MEFLPFIVLGFFASAIAGVFGFGSAMIMLAFGPYLVGAEQAVALSAVLFGASTLTKSLLFRQHMHWRIVLIMAVASVPFAYLGGLLMPALPAGVLPRLLGAMILFYLATTRFNFLPRFRIGTPGLVAGAAAYGLTSGLIGSGNVIKVVMFREMNISRESFVGAMAATSVLASLAKASAYWQSGLLNPELAWPMAGLVAVAVVAALLGRGALRKMSAGWFDTGIQLLLLVAAVGLLL
jgi:uncharacterized membrane protein YfcA